MLQGVQPERREARRLAGIEHSEDPALQPRGIVERVPVRR
jgi:hypothetical protein